MLFVKIIVAVIAIALILISIAAPNDGEIDVPFFFELGIFPGVACIPLDIALWGNFRVLFIISIILLAISIVGIIAFYIIKKIDDKKQEARNAEFVAKMKEESLKRALTPESLESIPQDLLKSAHFFISGQIEMSKTETKLDSASESGKVVLKSSSLENTIIIDEDTKGKLLSIDNGMVKIQFDATEDCSLFFRIFEDNKDGKYWLCREDGTLINDTDTIVYNKEEYKVSSVIDEEIKDDWEFKVRIGSFYKQVVSKWEEDEKLGIYFYPPYLMYKLEEISSSKTVTTKAKGAW